MQELIVHLKTGDPVHIWITDEDFEDKGATQNAILEACEEANRKTGRTIADPDQIIRVETGEHQDDDEFEDEDDEEEELEEDEEEEITDDAEAIAYCERMARVTIAGTPDEHTSRQWNGLARDIRSKGLEAMIASCQRYIQKSRTDPGRFDKRTYDTTVTQQFLDHLGY